MSEDVPKPPPLERGAIRPFRRPAPGAGGRGVPARGARGELPGGDPLATVQGGYDGGELPCSIEELKEELAEIFGDPLRLAAELPGNGNRRDEEGTENGGRIVQFDLRRRGRR